MKAQEFRKQWSHKPTPIPPDATGLWYSEECTDQLMEAFSAELQRRLDDCQDESNAIATNYKGRLQAAEAKAERYRLALERISKSKFEVSAKPDHLLLTEFRTLAEQALSGEVKS